MFRIAESDKSEMKALQPGINQFALLTSASALPSDMLANNAKHRPIIKRIGNVHNIADCLERRAPEQDVAFLSRSQNPVNSKSLGPPGLRTKHAPHCPIVLHFRAARM